MHITNIVGNFKRIGIIELVIDVYQNTHDGNNIYFLSVLANQLGMVKDLSTLFLLLGWYNLH